jgi:hypothetical protein
MGTESSAVVRELNPLDRYKRFQIILSYPSSGFILAQRKFPAPQAALGRLARRVPLQAAPDAYVLADGDVQAHPWRALGSGHPSKQKTEIWRRAIESTSAVSSARSMDG